MAKPHEEIHDQMLANLRDRVQTERGRLRRTLSGEPDARPEAPAPEGPKIDLAPRIRARRRGAGRLYRIFQAWAEEPPSEL